MGKCNSEDSFYFRASSDKAASVDHKWRPFYSEHGDYISVVCIFIHFVCRYMKLDQELATLQTKNYIRENFEGFRP